MTSRSSGGEFPRPVDVLGLPAQGRVHEITAGEEERAAVAKRLGVPAVARLAGSLSLRPTPSGVRVTGRLEAELTRRCVVTLEHLTEAICEEFEIRFERGPQTPVVEVDLTAGEDAPEPLEGAVLDLGEVLTQQLAVAMNPYPRLKGAALQPAEFGQPIETSPFAILKGAIAGNSNEE